MGPLRSTSAYVATDSPRLPTVKKWETDSTSGRKSRPQDWLLERRERRPFLSLPLDCIGANKLTMPDEEVVHEARAGETQRLASQAFQTRLQCEVRALDLLHCQLSHCVLRRRKIPLIDTSLVRVIPSDTKGGEQRLEFQEHRLFPGPHHIGQYSPRVMINRMP